MKIPKFIRFPRNEQEKTQRELYYKETHQHSNIVQANKKTLKALLKKKIDIIELYSDTKNLHHYNELKCMNKRDRSKTQFFNNEGFKEKTIVTHNLKNLQNLDTLSKEKTNSLEFTAVYTPIRKESSSEKEDYQKLCREGGDRMDFIKTYEYFSNSNKSKQNISQNNNYRRLSLNFKSDLDFHTKFPINLSERIAKSGSFTEKFNKEKYFLEEKQNSKTNSVVILNHMGLPLKFSYK